MLTNTVASRVDAALSGVEVGNKTARDGVGRVGKVAQFDAAACQFQQRRRIVCQLLDELHDEWIVSKTELDERQSDDVWRQSGQPVVVQTEGLESRQVRQSSRQRRQLIVTEDQRHQRCDATQFGWQSRQAVATQVQDLQPTHARTHTHTHTHTHRRSGVISAKPWAGRHDRRPMFPLIFFSV